MRSPRIPRAIAAIVAAALVLSAACGTDDTSTPADAGSSTTMADDGHGHSHGGTDVDGWSAIPTVALTATADSVSGVNLRLETTNFAFAPEHASGDPVEGEGHAHVYVDGDKVGRVYGEWLHVSGVSAGEHEIRVDLNGNDHGALLLGGEPIDDSVTLTVPEPAMAHGHDDGREAAAPAPTVSLTLTEDAKSGFNVRVQTTDFTFAPEKASGDPADGEGHAHLYVDGQKVARLYGEWFHLDGLDAGEHEVTVSLNGNDHVALLADGGPIEATQTVMVAGEDSSGDPADTVIEVSVTDGSVTGGGRHEVDLGEKVTLRVTSDVADEVHLHGYDVTVDVGAGETADLTFVADIPGVFEVELETAGLALVELQIS